MPSRFDWQAEDERRWGEVEPSKGRWFHDRKSWRLLVVILLVLTVVAAGSIATLIRVERFLDASSGDVEQTVLGVHDLVMTSAASGDRELFGGLIFDRLPEWTDSQLLLAEQGLLLDRRPLNLYLPPGTAPESVSVDLSASLSRAQVNVDYRYQVESGSAKADSVVLRQVFTYRLDEDQWLLDPPTGAFWGPRQTTSGRYLTMNYPQRDQHLAQRLAADFEAVVGQVCHSVAELNCPADIHITIDMVEDAAVLVELADPSSLLKGGLNMDLPAPTILGVPVDQPGYRALYRAYAARIAAALIAEQTGANCCQPRLLDIALLESILNRLGLTAWPLEPGLSPSSGGEALSVANALWLSVVPPEHDSHDARSQSAYALIEFLTTSWSAVPPAEMLRLQTRASNLREWLNMIAPAEGQPSFKEAWRDFSERENSKSGPVAGMEMNGRLVI